MVRFSGDTGRSNSFVIGSLNDKASGLIVIIRKLDMEVCAADDFMEVNTESSAWTDSELYDWLRKSNDHAQDESNWCSVRVGPSLALVIYAGTVVRFRPSNSSCNFVCMGYSNFQSNFTLQDVEFEEFVVPFLRRIPTDMRQAILTNAKKKGGHQLRAAINPSTLDMSHEGPTDSRLSLEATENEPPEAKGMSAGSPVDQLFHVTRKELMPLVRYIRGDRLEDIFERHPQDRRSEKLQYLLHVENLTEDFFEEYPSEDTGNRNSPFWARLSNPGFRGSGAKTAFAKRHGYDISTTLKILSKGGKIRATTGDHREPGFALFFLQVVNSLDRISYYDARELGNRLWDGCPDVPQSSAAFREKWVVYKSVARLLAHTFSVQSADAYQPGQSRNHPD
ncbi:hypothetical protein BDV33DRAFT_185402 [Aspergillus novoparasiticus]|uniref:Uncharacterized protein n=1 Tax=Aspergillus novoparasiticus TaxID=986946 RepID=A0A5N6E6C4_9EURO|nr:hypothetical protein BDV33DRAFT_185402 [Aspergillus novoparasiticus]